MAAAVRAAEKPTDPAPSITTRAGGTPGVPPEQDSAAAGAGAQQVRGDGDGHLAGDLADGGEHRQAAIRSLDDLAADRRDAPFGQRFEQPAIGHRHVVEGHQGSAGTAEAQLFGGGPADLGHQIRPLDHFGRRIGDARPGAGILGVAEHGALARAGFHPHGVAGPHQAPRHGRRQPHAPVIGAALAYHPDIHEHLTAVVAARLATLLIFGPFGADCNGERDPEASARVFGKLSAIRCRPVGRHPRDSSSVVPGRARWVPRADSFRTG